MNLDDENQLMTKMRKEPAKKQTKHLTKLSYL
jgi:hypothetical protein